MELKSLELKNFKKFTKISHKFERTNLIIEPNGFGKTTIFQAILFALYGERPVGGTFNSFLKNPDEKAIVRLVYEEAGHEYTITRVIGGTPSIHRDGEANPLTTSAKEITQIAESHYPKGVRDVLVNYGSLGLLQLKPSIIDELILDRTPQRLQGYYKKLSYDTQLLLKKMEADSEKHVRMIKQLISMCGAKDPEDLRKTLSSIDGVSKEVIDRVAELEGVVASFEIPEDGFGLFKNPHAAAMMTVDRLENEISRAKLKIEQEELLPDRGLSIPSNIIEASNKAHECVVCGNHLGDHISPSRDNRTLNSLREELEKNQWILDNLAELRKAALVKDAERELTSLKNLYGDKLEIANSSPFTDSQVSEGLFAIKAYNQLLIDINSSKKLLRQVSLKQGITTQFITEQRDALSNQITSQATKLLNMYYNSTGFRAVTVGEDNAGFAVVIEDVIRPLSFLSSGERTIVNFCLILAVAKIFPGLPVILDEPFGNLDSVNKPASLSVATQELEQNQLFLTNH